MFYLKIGVWALAVIGSCLAVGEKLRWFRDRDRMEFAEVIQRDLECPKDHPGAIKFINDFLLSKPGYASGDVEAKVEKVIYVGTWVGNAGGRSGRDVDFVMSGVLKVKKHNGDVSQPLCAVEEMKAWAEQSPLVWWIGWVVVVVSLALQAVLMVIEEAAKRKGTIMQQGGDQAAVECAAAHSVAEI